MTDSTQGGTPGGILILDKPQDMTSHDAVNKVRKLYNTKQVGHTGTLDPMATGLLCVLVGRAVKASEYAVCDGKEYEAGLTLGRETDTEDIWGTVTKEYEGNLPGEAEVKAVCREFTGEIMQVPPMYSALKYDGKKLVDLARKGVTVEREARKITVHSLGCEKDAAGGDGEYKLKITCSKGTYIRTLCADIGKKLGCGAVMSSLRRTQVGRFGIGDARTIENLENMTQEERYGVLLPVERLWEDQPAVELPEFFARLAHAGNEIYQKKIGKTFPEGQIVRLYDENGFFALAQAMTFEDGSALKPVKQFRL